MWEILSWLFFIIFIAGLLVVGGLLLRGYLTTGTPTGGLTGSFFSPKAEKRLDVVEQEAIDGRRRLVLIRRDDVEHLIMTGGPVDVVIETGISKKLLSKAEVVDGPGTVYKRPSRSFGQAVGDN